MLTARITLTTRPPDQLSVDAPCGHCSRCLGAPPCDASRQTNAKLDDQLLEESLSGLKANQDVFCDPRSAARYLCGVSSPKSSRARLTKKEPFGVFEQVAFSHVLEAVTERWP